MFPKSCNIDKTDRINRIVIGVLLLIATVLGMSKLFFIVISLVLIIEGIVGWCSIPYFLDRIRKKGSTRKK